MTANQLLSLIFETTESDLSPAYSYWLYEVVDLDKDRHFSSQEINSAICEVAHSTKNWLKIKPKNQLVQNDGSLELLAFEAADNNVSVTEFQVYFGHIFYDYILRSVQKTAEQKVYDSFKNLIDSGLFTVSTEEIREQIDVMAVDSSIETKYFKLHLLGLAIGELEQKVPAEKSAIIYKKVLNLFLQQKNWPRLLQTSTLSTTFSINSAQGSETGVPGAKNYYLLKGTSIRIFHSDQPDIWGQPSDQVRITLRDPQYYKTTPDSFIQKYKNLLAASAQSLKNMSWLETFSFDSDQQLQQWGQIFINTITQQAFAEPVQFEVSEQIHLAGVTAHYQSKKRLITLDSQYFKTMRTQIGDTAMFLRYFVAVLSQEVIHALQHDYPQIYEDNFLFYNHGNEGYQIFGNIGGNWYHQQPVERDAHELAAFFTERLFSKELSAP